MLQIWTHRTSPLVTIEANNHRVQFELTTYNTGHLQIKGEGEKFERKVFFLCIYVMKLWQQLYMYCEHIVLSLDRQPWHVLPQPDTSILDMDKYATDLNWCLPKPVWKDSLGYGIKNVNNRSTSGTKSTGRSSWWDETDNRINTWSNSPGNNGFSPHAVQNVRQNGS